MIQKWSKQDLKDLEYVKDGQNLFVDQRGSISNHELNEPINLIGLIESKKEHKSQSLSSSTRTEMFIHKRTNYRSFSRFIKSKITKNYSSSK